MAEGDVKELRKRFAHASRALRDNDLVTAREVWSSLAQAHPGEPNVELLGATILRLERRPELSLPILRSLQQRFPGDVSIGFQLASALRDTQQSAEAIAEYGAVLARRPTYAEAAYQLAKLLKRELPVQAGPLFLRAHRADPSLQGALHMAMECARDAARAGSCPALSAPPAPSNPLTKVSVACCSIQPDRLARLRGNLDAVLTHWELVHIPDARSLSEGYNRALRECQGDYVVFCHDDIRILSPQFSTLIRSYLTRYDVVGVAGTTRFKGPAALWSGGPDSHAWVIYREGETFLPSISSANGPVVEHAQLLDGVFIAARREVACALGFDEETFDGFHLYDVDFSWRAHLAGYRVAICQDLLIEHLSRGSFDASWKEYAMRFFEKFPGLPSEPPRSTPNSFEVAVASEAEVRGVYSWITTWLHALDSQAV